MGVARLLHGRRCFVFRDSTSVPSLDDCTWRMTCAERRLNMNMVLVLNSFVLLLQKLLLIIQRERLARTAEVEDGDAWWPPSSAGEEQGHAKEYQCQRENCNEQRPSKFRQTEDGIAIDAFWMSLLRFCCCVRFCKEGFVRGLQNNRALNPCSVILCAASSGDLPQATPVQDSLGSPNYG